MRTISNPEQFRLNIRNKINEILNNQNQSDNLEKGIYNWALKESTTRKVVKKWDNLYFIEIYQNHLRSIYINLKNNPKLLNLIQSGEMKAHEIAFMTHQEMKPEKWEALIDRLAKLNKNKFEVNLQAATDTFTCRKCKSKKCTYTQVQTRSADEPMTTFVSCIDCGCRWKC
jgi:transcription elongation factor S-II